MYLYKYIGNGEKSIFLTENAKGNLLLKITITVKFRTIVTYVNKGFYPKRLESETY